VQIEQKMMPQPVSSLVLEMIEAGLWREASCWQGKFRGKLIVVSAEKRAAS
jgi:hypothetical protein